MKSASTYYTPAKVAAARHNVRTYDWAGSLADSAIAAAAPYLAKGDDWLWSLVTGQHVPRSNAVEQTLGSPTTGQKVYQWGNYPYLGDPLTMPWKIVDPSTDTYNVFPTNDFGAYYQSGLDEHGLFDPDRADRSLLVNSLYPDKGPTWCVDDGYGWIDDDGHRWTFIAYYNHWHVWWTFVNTAKGAIFTANNAFRDAFLYTGDIAYAHAGLILLDRIADVYPSMDISAYRVSDGYQNSHGGTGKGKVVGSIWEAQWVKEIVASYDAYFPAIATSDGANVVPFLSAKAQRYALPPKNSIDDIKNNIEDNLIRQIYPGVKNAQIRGNFGMHQSALTLAAVVLDNPSEAQEWVDFTFATGGLESKPDWHVTGGDIEATLVDDVDRDGFGNEAAPNYNVLWLTEVGSVADTLDGYDGFPTANLYDHPKFRKMWDCRHTITMLNAYTAGIGDSGSTGRPNLYGTAASYVFAYERFGKPEYAQMAYLLNGNSADGLYSSVFATNVDQTRQRIADLIEGRGPLWLPSDDLTGYGFAALRAGTGDAMRGLWVYYGRSVSGHAHADALNLDLYGVGVDLAPELGYPEFTGENARRREWVAGTIAHNTVLVDAHPQLAEWVGVPHGFGATDRVQMLDIAAPKAYPQTSVYRRVTAMVTVDAQNSYVVDVFRVVGGHEHHFSFHGAEGPVAVDGLHLTVQPTGTYAGPGVEPPPDDAPARPGANGFDWLFDVSRDGSPPAGFALDWKVTDTWAVHDPDPDLHLRLNFLTQVDDVALCDGIPPRNKPGNPASLRYLIAHRAGPAGQDLGSAFVSVLEPYVGRRFVGSVECVEARALDPRVRLEAYEVSAVKVTLTSGRVDYVVSSLREDVLLLVDGKALFQGAFGVYSTESGKPPYVFGHGLRIFGPFTGLGALTGTVRGFTRDLAVHNTITLALDRSLPKGLELAGSYVAVENDGIRNAVYPIQAVRTLNSKTIELDIGDVVTVRQYVDPNDFSKGYVYDLAVGAKARIPVTAEFRVS